MLKSWSAKVRQAQRDAKRRAKAKRRRLKKRQRLLDALDS